MIYSLRQPLKKYIFLSRSVMQQATSNKSSLQYCVNIVRYLIIKMSSK